MVEQPAFRWFEPEVQACAGFVEFYQGRHGPAQAFLASALAGFAARPADQTVSPVLAAAERPGRGVGDRAGLRERGARASSTPPDAGRPRPSGGPRRSGSRAARSASPSSRPTPPGSAGSSATTRPPGGSAPRSSPSGGSTATSTGSTLGSAYLAADAPGQRGRPRVPRADHRDPAADGPGGVRRLRRWPTSPSCPPRAGDVARADELIDEALAVVDKTGEDLHLPELLRQRALYALARGDDPGGAVADLTEAVRIATEQGARVARLRAAVQLARVPPEARPADWRAVLADARADLPPSLSTVEHGRRRRAPGPVTVAGPRVVVLGGGMAGLADGLGAQLRRLAATARLDHRLPAGLAAGRQGSQQPRGSTAGSRSTACTSSSATTTRPSGSCARSTPSSTAPAHRSGLPDPHVARRGGAHRATSASPSGRARAGAPS